MVIARKIFITVFFSMLTIPFLFFAWGLIGMEYDEYLVYGDIESAKIINIRTEGMSGEYINSVVYDIKILKTKQFKDKIYFFSIQIDKSTTPDKEDDEFMLQSKVGDTVKVKIKSSHQAKVMEWKHHKLNKATDYWGIFWTWVVIIVLLVIPSFIYYKIYKTLIK